MRETPPTAFVVIAPLKMEFPDPASWVTVFALIVPEAVRVETEDTVKLSRRVAAPRLPLNVILPSPATRVKLWLPAVCPFTVLDNVIFPAPAPASSVRLPVKVIARKNDMFPVVVVRLSWIDTAPAPFCWKKPAIVMLPVEVSVPVFVNVTDPPPVVVKVPDLVIPLPVTWIPVTPFVL